MGFPRITVLTIVYNGERYLREAIDSILCQTCKDFEYILVDNNSTDSTPRILKDYSDKDNRIKVIRETKQGVLYARNAGLRVTRGDWVAVLDADDVALPNRLERQLGFMEKNPDVVLVGSGCFMIDEVGKHLKQYRYPLSHKSLVECLENRKAFFPHSSAFFKKVAVTQLGGYRFPHAEDYDLWFRLSEKGRISCIEQPLIKLRRFVVSRSYGVSQEEYLLFTFAGLFCHLLRKEGLVDLFSTKERVSFLLWIRGQMKNLNCFKKGKAARELCRIWYSKGNKFKCLSQIFWKFISDKYAREFLLDRDYLEKAAMQIAQEVTSGIKFNSFYRETGFKC